MISIIIPTLNEEATIKKTLSTLRESLAGFPCELIISDGTSTDKTAEIARQYADNVIVYAGTTRQTIAQGKNDGAKVAKGDLLVFIDADITVPRADAFFKELTEFFEKRKDVVALTMPVRPLPGVTTFTDKIGMGIFNIFYRIFNNVLRSGNSSGEFQMVRADKFRSIGGFREDLPSSEDNDLFRRFGKIGRTFFYPKLNVFHPCRRAHAIGWPLLIWKSLRSGTTVMVSGKSPYKEWEVVR